MGQETSDKILGVIWITVWIHEKYMWSDSDHCLQKYEIEGGKEISVPMIGFESQGIEIPCWRSVFSECSLLLIH